MPVLALLLPLVACVEAPSTNDASSVVVDGGIPDASMARDAAVPPDASTPPDAGPLDAAVADAAFPPDAAYMLPDVVIDRSLAWSDATLLDDSTAVGLSQLLSSMCDGVSPGVMLDHWLRKFGTTAHSERFGPVLLADEIASQHGPDPSAWPVDTLPIEITGVHNRIDLQSQAHCGEFRVSAASVHPIYRPLHFIWLFRMEGTDCTQVARRWAELSTLDDQAFRTAARAMLLEHLTTSRFLIAETVEFTVSPWEWRQWRPQPNPDVNDPSLPCVLENPPLFQQVDRDSVNAPGATRDAFLAFVENNADALDARTLLIPEEFRAPSIRAAQGVPWVPLDLTGVSESTLQAHPTLRQNLEMVGCAACHATDAPFVQTAEDRTRSPFYTRELEARRDLLRRYALGERPSVPFGPLQTGYVLPP
ncbi:MAG: hypothetical protein AB2A00_01730 [Myxococcota bacterium]